MLVQELINLINLEADELLDEDTDNIPYINQAIDYLITSQSVMLATNEMMALLGLLFIFSATLIWLAPRPKREKSSA